MKVGDLVQRCSTGKIDIVIDVILGASPSSHPSPMGRLGTWVRTADNQDRLTYAANYEVISESR